VSGAVKKDIDAKLDCSGMKVAIVAARWNDELVDLLVKCAEDEAKKHGAKDVTIEYVDGSGELASGVQILARSGEFDAIAAFGVIVRGGTPHFETVLQRATDGLLRVSLDEGVPIGDGVVAVYDLGQAKLRAGGENSHEDKGAGAMHAALSLAVLKKKYSDQ